MGKGSSEWFWVATVRPSSGHVFGLTLWCFGSDMDVGRFEIEF